MSIPGIAIAIVINAALVVALVVLGQNLERRRRQRIRQLVAARGGNVVKIALAPPLGRLVDYVGPEGELRQTTLRRGETTFWDDKPYELVLKEEYERARDELYATVVLAASYSRLPGYEAYKSLILELAAGSRESVIVAEAASDVTAKFRFAPLLQCFEVMRIPSKLDSTDSLELVVNGTSFNVRWTVEGQAPNRSLVVSAVRPGTNSSRQPAQ